MSFRQAIHTHSLQCVVSMRQGDGRNTMQAASPLPGQVARSPSQVTLIATLV